MDHPSIQNLEQEIADLQAHEKELANGAVKPSKFAQAMKDKRELLEKVKTF